MLYRLYLYRLSFVLLCDNVEKGIKKMKINPYRKIMHSTPEYAVRGTDITLSVAVLEGYQSSSPSLSVVVFANDKKTVYPMTEGDGVKCAHVFSATVPASCFDGASVLDYEIVDGIFTLFEGEIKVIERPHIPPVVITEVYSRVMRGKVDSKFIEITNFTDKAADLYNVRLERFYKGNSTGSCVLASEPESVYLNPGETVAIRFLTKESFDEEGNIIESEETYLRGIYNENPYDKLEYKPARTIIVDGTRINPTTGAREANPDVLLLGPDQKPTLITLTDREGNKDENYFEITLNKTCEEIDVLMARSALFALDVKDPSRGRNLIRNTDPTPGVLDPRIPVPTLDDTQPPLIVIESPKSNHLASDGEMKIEYTVVGGAANTYAELFLKDGVKRIYAKSLGDDRFVLTVPEEIVTSVKELCASIVAEKGIYISRFGDMSSPLAFTVIDNVGPDVHMVSPKPDFCYSGEYSPTIIAELSDISGVNIPGCKIMLDSDDITDLVLWQGARFTYKPQSPLKEGSHKLKFVSYDLLGNCSRYSVSFGIAPYESMNCYFGEVHNHTAESDGSGTPSEAMEYARDVVGMDYFAVTEHSTYLIHEKYNDQIKTANRYNDPGRFAALYGWEMTWNNSDGLWGHMNIIGTRRVILDREKYSLGRFYEWIEENGGIAMFNHPGYPWGNFDEYSIPAEIANKYAALAEIKSVAYDREYAHMLKRGYHVAPVYNDDAHLPKWGNANMCTGYVLAPYLSRENVMQAFRERRTYSTSDRTLKMKYSINGKWLGSTLESPDELNVKVELSTENEMGIGNVQLVTVGGIVVAEINVGLRKSYTWDLKLAPEYPFYYVRIIGAGRYTVSAPVWISGNDGIAIEDLEIPSSFTGELPAVARFSVRNKSQEMLKNIKADIYLSGSNGMKDSDLPYETVYFEKLKPGERVTFSRKLPVVSGYRAFTVSASGEGKNQVFRDTDTVLLSQLLIAEVVPLTRDLTVTNTDGEDKVYTNPFPYVKLYNASCKDISLDNASIRLWNKAGKAPTDGCICQLKGLTIKANSTLTVWKRKNSELTAENFNTRYGTELIEGDNLYITSQKITDSTGTASRIDVLCNGEVVSRVTYNHCVDSMKTEVEADKAFNYLYIPNYTITSTRLYSLTAPNPSAVYDEQIPGNIIGGPKKKEISAEKKAVKLEEKKKKAASSKGIGAPVVGGVAAAGVVLGTVLGLGHKVSPSAKAKADAKLIAKAEANARKAAEKSETKLMKASEKRMVKAISSEINKTVDKRIADRSILTIDSRMKADKDAIKQAKKNMKVLKMQKKAEKATAKREAEIKKAQDS